MSRIKAEKIAPVPYITLENVAVKKSSNIVGLQAFVLMASLLMITLSVNLQVPLYKVYAHTAGYSNGFIAVAFSAYIVGLLPVLIMFGGISDRIGRKPVMLLSLLIAFFANVFMILEPSMLMLVKVRVLQGVAVALSLGAATAYLTELLKNPTRSANIAGFVITVGLGCGSLLTSIALVYEFSIIPVSYFGISIAILICSLMMSFMPATSGIPSKKIFRLPYLSAHTITYCFSIFFAWSLTGIIIATLPGELERIHYSNWTGLLVLFAICVGAICQPLSRKINPAASMAIGYTLLISAFTLMLAGVKFSSLGIILIAAACSGASSFGFIYLGGLSAVVQSSGPEKARAVSGYFLFAYLGLGLPCIFTGYVAEKNGLFPALLLSGCILGTAMILVFLYGQKMKRTTSNHVFETINCSKEEIKQNEKKRMEQFFDVSSSWSLKEKMALTCRILYAHGHGSGLSGQITAKTECGTFITQRLGYGLDEITVSNLLEVDEDLNVVAGDGMPNPANRFHSWIYRSRPEVRCIIHTHPMYISALSMLEEPLKVSHMDACVLYDEIAFLPKWPGIPIANEEGEMISSALKDKKALLLAHHGLVVVSDTIEEACVIALQFERAAKLHMIASSVGAIRDIDPELGKEAHDWVLQKRRSVATFSYYARQILRSNPACLYD